MHHLGFGAGGGLAGVVVDVDGWTRSRSQRASGLPGLRNRLPPGPSRPVHGNAFSPANSPADRAMSSARYAVYHATVRFPDLPTMPAEHADGDAHVCKARCANSAACGGFVLSSGLCHYHSGPAAALIKGRMPAEDEDTLFVLLPPHPPSPPPASPPTSPSPSFIATLNPALPSILRPFDVLTSQTQMAPLKDDVTAL